MLRCKKGYTGAMTIWVNEMNFVMNHAPDAGSTARPVDQQSTLYYIVSRTPPKCCCMMVVLLHWNMIAVRQLQGKII